MIIISLLYFKLSWQSWIGQFFDSCRKYQQAIVFIYLKFFYLKCLPCDAGDSGEVKVHNCGHMFVAIRKDRDVNEPEVIYEASDEESGDDQLPPLHLLAASDSER